MGGRSFQIGSDFGWIWYKKKFRRNTRDRSSSKIDDEENCTLDGKAKRGKGKKSYSKFETGK